MPDKTLNSRIAFEIRRIFGEAMRRHCVSFHKEPWNRNGRLRHFSRRAASHWRLRPSRGSSPWLCLLKRKRPLGNGGLNKPDRQRSERRPGAPDWLKRRAKRTSVRERRLESQSGAHGRRAACKMKIARQGDLNSSGGQGGTCALAAQALASRGRCRCARPRRRRWRLRPSQGSSPWLCLLKRKRPRCGDVDCAWWSGGGLEPSARGFSVRCSTN